MMMSSHSACHIFKSTIIHNSVFRREPCAVVKGEEVNVYRFLCKLINIAYFYIIPEYTVCDGHPVNAGEHYKVV